MLLLATYVHGEIKVQFVLQDLDLAILELDLLMMENVLLKLEMTNQNKLSSGLARWDKHKQLHKGPPRTGAKRYWMLCCLLCSINQLPNICSCVKHTPSYTL